MKTIWQYPVSYGFGNVPGYDGFHSGEDRGNSSAFGLPVTVNGVTIGTVGWTGYVLPKDKNGTHTHIGRFVGGQATNPNGGGERLGADATVTQVGEDSRNGKFVRVTSLGVDWYYLHLNSVQVNKGDKLGGNVATKADRDAVRYLFEGFLDRQPNEGEYANFIGKDLTDVLWTVYTSREYKKRYAGLVEHYKAWKREQDGVGATVLAPGNYKVK